MQANPGPQGEFHALQQLHRQSLPFYKGLAIFYALIGVALLLASLFLTAPFQLTLAVIGAAALAMAAYPFLSLKDRNERIDGLGFLEDEWREVQLAGDRRPGAREGMINLLWSIYDSNKREN